MITHLKTKIETYNISEWLCRVVLLFCFIPIYQSSSKYQGWGGDYAGYLLEAKHIAEGVPLHTSNYLYNPGYASLAPPAYPVGFPIILVPVYEWFGLDILMFTRLMGMLWWIVGCLMFWMLRRDFSRWVALGAAVLFLFNPLLFFERNAVLSDFPFTICVLLSVIFYTGADNNRSLKNAALVGFWAGYAWLTRTVGFVLPIAIVGHFLLEHWYFDRNNQLREKRWWLYPLVVLGIGVGMQVIFHHLLFSLPDSGSYFDQIKVAEMSQYVKSNLTNYLEKLIGYFQVNGDLWYIYRYKSTDMAVVLGGALAIGFTLIGLIQARTRSERFYIQFTVAYFLVILLWPSFQGLRFLVPILPFLMYFMLKAIKNQDTGEGWRSYVKWCIIPLLLYGEYYRLDHHIWVYSQTDEIGAPEWKNNQDAFQYVRDSVPDGAIFGYHHPLIFTLYVDKPVMRWVKNGTPQDIQTNFDQFNVQYLLLNDWLVAADESLKNYLVEHSKRLDTVWHNERNVLYKFK
jgi:hypothetical protein